MDKVLILDFGSQYNQLIARRVRSLRVYCEIHPHDISINQIKEWNPKAVILSGGPSSVTQNDSPMFSFPVDELKDFPVLGICYGMQALVQATGGKVSQAEQGEYGAAQVFLQESKRVKSIFPDSIRKEGLRVWMSHGDSIESLPSSWTTLASSQNCPYVAVAHREFPWFGVQFHPEVSHTEQGTEILERFVKGVAHCEEGANPVDFLTRSISQIRETVGQARVISGLSGGVDSLITTLILKKAIGDQVIPVFVDTGLSREGDVERIRKGLKEGCNIEPTIVRAQDEFLEALKGVVDPEEKRKIIGGKFIEIFTSIAEQNEAFHLAQGTLYPDVIESISTHGPSHTIKSHHNVGGLPKEHRFKLVEPLRAMFKDEVRELGAYLGAPNDLIHQQPFPGPGLAVRIIGEVTKERCDILRYADAVVREVVEKDKELVQRLWQWFAVLIPVKTVGVMGDARTYENLIAVRMVESTDGMTADWAAVSHDTLKIISNRIINEVEGVNRVVYDISSKPPGTIEWE